MEGKFSSPRNSADYIRQGQTPPRKPRKKRRRRRRRLNPNFVILCIIALVILCLLIYWLVGLFRGDSAADPVGTEPPAQTSTQAPTEPFEPIRATATIAATGDVLMHMPVVNSCYDSASGNYDFSNIFQYLDDYAAEADYAVANLETTLAGTDNGYAYSGYPNFNCPDSITNGLKGAGFDMLLTANNHCYDTGTVGLTRTLRVAAEAGLDTLGTQSDASAADYVVQDLNGIQVGMMCYSYATADSYPDRPSMNGILVRDDAADLVNYFDYDQLDAFYTEVRETLTAMEAAGADASVMFIHWGEEYQLSPNANQTAIAQELCDLGIDVIVGGHPHVVQPMELLTSSDGSNKTVCLYSMGNAISNQQRQNMNLNTGHTEDGVLFSFTFTEYADGEVLLTGVDLLPIWVYLNGGAYRVLPLDSATADWASAYGISQSAAASAQESYDRTMALVGEGLAASQEYLSSLHETKLAEITPSNS